MALGGCHEAPTPRDGPSGSTSPDLAHPSGNLDDAAAGHVDDITPGTDSPPADTNVEPDAGSPSPSPDAGSPSPSPDAGSPPPPPTGGFSFFVVGDTRSDPSTAQQIFDSMVQLDPNAIALFNSGDITADGNASQWQNHVQAINLGSAGKIRTDLASWNKSAIRYFGIVGNHDAHDSNWFSNWNTFLPGQKGLGHNATDGVYFTVQYGNALFIVLDSENDYKQQTPWLQQVLANAAADPSIKWKFAFYHHPIYPCNYKSAWSSGIPWMREFEKYGVDMVFNGHAHVYQRGCATVGGACQSGGVIQVISGGGGAGTQSMSPSELSAKRSAGADSYDCGQLVQSAIGSWHHYCHLRVTDSQVVYNCYSAGATTNPEDSLTLSK